MKITGFQDWVVKLPARRIHNWASKMNTPIGHHYIVRIETDEGVVGWGETPAVATWGGPHGMYFGEDAGTVRYVVHTYLLPVLEGEDPRQIGACHRLMDRSIKGHPYAKAAVDLALHDIAGKAAGVPVYELLGGKLRDSIPVCHSLGIMDVQPAVDEAIVAVREGIGTIKCKTGLDPKRDVELVAKLRETVGPDVKIRVDANEAYPTAREAARITNEMEPYGIVFHEQPVAGFEALAEVARMIRVPIMADESAWYPRDILRLHELRAADILSLYYTKPGGLYRAKEVVAVAKACDFTSDIGGSIEMGIGVAANLHLGVSSEILTWASVCPVPNPDGSSPVTIAGTYYLDDIVKEPLRYEAGQLYAPDKPGLGVEVDEAKLKKYAA